MVSAVPALNVALPDLASDTGATMSQLQWIVDAYALVFAALLLPAGAVGDRYGRKRVLVWGLALFALGSAGAAMTSTPNVLIGFRGIMGLGAALVMPSTLSIITTSLPTDRRSKAVAAWVGVAGAGAILGLVAAGALLERLGMGLGVLVVRRRGAGDLPRCVPVDPRLDRAQPASRRLRRRPPVGRDPRGLRVRNDRGSGARLG